MANDIHFISDNEINQISNIKFLVKQLNSEYKYGFSDISIPQRTIIKNENPFSAFVNMPAYSKRHNLFITKIGGVVPQIDPRLKSVHSILVVLSAKTGKPLAILDGNGVTNLKCAAIAALVTDICALPDSKVLTIIGSGIQAREQIRGIGSIRNLKQIRLYSRNNERLLTFIKENIHLCPEAEFIACNNAEEAAYEADIISTATTSVKPVIAADSLKGKLIHINCVGNHTSESREIPLSILQQSILIVEDLNTAISEAGGAHRNAIDIEYLVKQDTTIMQQQRTVFASTGHAFLDLVTVSYLLDKLKINS